MSVSRCAVSSSLASFLAVVALGLGGSACGDSSSPSKDAADSTTTAPDADTSDTGTPTDAVTDATVPDDTTAPDAEDADGSSEPTLVLHYHRPDNAYAGWTVDVSGAVTSAGLTATGNDDFGAIFEIGLGAAGAATTLSYQLHGPGGATDPATPQLVELATATDGIWQFAGAPQAPDGLGPLFHAPPAIPGPDQLAVYYLRKDGAYAGWGLHTWQDVAHETQWTAALQPGGTDAALGAWFLVDLKPSAQQVGIIVHKGDEKDPGPDMFVDVPATGDMVFLASASTEISTFPIIIPEVAISGAAAHWLDADTIAWNPKGAPATVELRHAADASVRIEGADIVGGDAFALTKDVAGLPADVKAAFPHLASRGAWTIAASDLTAAHAALGDELVAVARDGTGKVVDATRVQIAGVLDALYSYDGPLGVHFDADSIDVALWAPTAQDVKLERFATAPAPSAAIPAPSETVDMTRGADGVWRTSGPASWKNQYYRYRIVVFHPTSAKVETVFVTDPYSLSLSANGRLTQLVDVDDAALMPADWGNLTKPAMAAPEDIVLYELHVRDFSAEDTSVPVADRGKYKAFTYNGVGGGAQSAGMGHLEALAEAGLTHVHLLPSFDFATVDEDPANRLDLDSGFDKLCAKNAGIPAAICTLAGTQTIRARLAAADPAGDDAQEIVNWLRGVDGFNWGYDPVHYLAPEGSYASDPDGGARVLETRQMVKGLWQIGLRVVADVVYNHTSQAGLGEKTVLDKVVPGYYHRLNPDTGLVETSTCCSNTATEHHMMGRLMVDGIVTWARVYKIDGFRFDLMGHHMKADMLKVRAALDALTPEADHVAGPAVYVYGEGWDFGEVAGGARGVNATQANMGGTGIGTFNDRVRDSVRGGSAFDGGNALRQSQGFANGLYTAPNELNTANDATRDLLYGAEERITVGMAGNLRQFKLTDHNGNTKNGQTIGYNGAPTGYTQDPQEAINYVEAHDNQTLFDIAAYHAPTGTSSADRERMQAIAMAVPLLGQGIPFLHAGVELLRSKSMDGNSYDSGDWFNRVDWTGASNNWNVGLPNSATQSGNYAVIGQILSDSTVKPSAADIAMSTEHLEQFLRVRASSPLFRLRTAADVQKRVHQRNVGPSQNPGVLFFTLSDGTCAGSDIDAAYDGVVVFINARPTASDFILDGASGWQLHPVMAGGDDAVVKGSTFADGNFHVPAWTAAVFVKPQSGAQGADPGCNPL